MLRHRSVVLVIVALALPALARGAATVASTDTIWTIAGGGQGGDGGLATFAEIDRPRHVSQAADGTLYVTEPFRHRVRKISPTGVITTFAGTGEAGFSGDGGPARAARLDFPHAAVPLPDGSVIIADTDNGRIRKVLQNGTIVSVAERLGIPRSVAGLPDGSFLVPDTNHHCVRRVDSGGAMTTVAGACGSAGFAGDGGPAIAALLNLPFSVEPLPAGGFLIAADQRIRRVDASGTITTVAGNGTRGFAGDGGPATSASLTDPHAVFPLPGGGFVIADSSAERVRMVSPAGIISTLTGTGARGFAGDGGAAADARVSVPKGVWLTSDGYLLIADEQNGRIRAIGRTVVPQAAAPPRVTGTATVFSKLVASTGSWQASGAKVTTPGPKFSFQWQRCAGSVARCTDITGATGAQYDVQPADTGWRLRVRVKASTPAGSASARSALMRRVPGALTTQLALTQSSADGSVSRIYRANGEAGPATVQTRGRDIVVARTRVGSGTMVSVGLLRFDTSAIPPGARITSVRLQFPVLVSGSQDRLRLLVEPYSGSRWPIERSDFAVLPRSAPVADYDPNWLQRGQNADIPLLPTAVDPRKRSSALRLLMPGGSAGGTNLIRFAAVDHRTLAGPTLLVTYEAR